MYIFETEISPKSFILFDDGHFWNFGTPSFLLQQLLWYDEEKWIGRASNSTQDKNPRTLCSI